MLNVKMTRRPQLQIFEKKNKQDDATKSEFLSNTEFMQMSFQFIFCNAKHFLRETIADVAGYVNSTQKLQLQISRSPTLMLHVNFLQHEIAIPCFPLILRRFLHLS